MAPYFCISEDEGLLIFLTAKDNIGLSIFLSSGLFISEQYLLPISSKLSSRLPVLYFCISEDENLLVCLTAKDNICLSTFSSSGLFISEHCLLSISFELSSKLLVPFCRKTQYSTKIPTELAPISFNSSVSLKRNPLSINLFV